MMQAKDFIKSELNAFIERFPRTRVRYEYDKNALVHFVEVLPSEVYNSDSDYIQWEDDVYMRFVEAFPTESICFISDNALVGIENPELVLVGSEYVLATSFSDIEIKYEFSTHVVQSNSFENVLFTECKIDDKTESFDIPNSYIVDSNILKAA